MIEKLRSMAIFAAVVDQGSFRAAAKHLGLAPSRVSHTVSELEKELGVTLLYRSTRRLALSNEGKILHGKVQQMLQAAETGLDAISQLSDAPHGELRITAPAFVTQTGLMETIADFARTYPNVSLKLNFSDQPRDLIKDGFDIGIRAGWLEDCNLMSRTVGHSNRLLVASPEYVASKKKPLTPHDLEQWQWLHFSMRPDRIEMIAKDLQCTTVICHHQIATDSADALYEFAIRGLGLTVIPENIAHRGLRHGELVHVLPEWSVRPLDFHAIWPDQSRRESLTLGFVRFLAENASQFES